MLPEQPCVDNYGNNVCHLKRFHLNDTPRSSVRPTPSSRHDTTFLPGVVGSSTPLIPPSRLARPGSAITFVPGVKGSRLPQSIIGSDAPLPSQDGLLRQKTGKDASIVTQVLSAVDAVDDAKKNIVSAPVLRPGLRTVNVSDLPPVWAKRSQLIGVGYMLHDMVDHLKVYYPNMSDEEALRASLTSDLLADLVHDIDPTLKVNTEISTADMLLLEDGEKGYIFGHGAGTNQEDNAISTLRVQQDQTNAIKSMLKPGDTVVKNYPHLPDFYDKAIAKFGVENLEGFYYSNGGPKGFYGASRGVQGTFYDPVIGGEQMRLLASGLKADVNIVSLSEKMQIASNLGPYSKIARMINNDKVKWVNVEPGTGEGLDFTPDDGLLTKWLKLHNLDHYAPDARPAREKTESTPQPAHVSDTDMEFAIKRGYTLTELLESTKMSLGDVDESLYRRWETIYNEHFGDTSLKDDVFTPEEDAFFKVRDTNLMGGTKSKPTFATVEPVQPQFDETIRIKTNSFKVPVGVTSALTQTGVGFGVGYGVSKVYQEMGMDNPYANATATGSTVGLLASGGEVAAAAAGRVAVRTALSSVAKGMAAGLIFAPIGVGVDQLTNMGYRASGLNKSTSGALSGASSALVVGGLSAGVATTSASIAAGELTFGPEMLPIAAATLLGGAIASWLGFAAGSDEQKADDRRKMIREHAKAETYLSRLLATGKYASYADAKAAMQKNRPSWAERIDGDFENEALNALAGKHGDRPTYDTIEELQEQRKHALEKWNNSAHYTGHGMRYGSLFWNSAPSRVTSKYDQEIKEAQYRAIANKFLASYMTAEANNRLDMFQMPLTPDEQKTLDSMDPNWRYHLETTGNLAITHQKLTAQRLERIQEHMLASIATGENVDLTQDEMDFLQQNPVQGEAILSRVHDAENQKMMRDTIAKTADDLNVSYTDLAQYYDNVNDGMTPERAWNIQAHSQGFISAADYERFRTNDPELHLEDIMTGQQEFARKALDLHAKANDAGFDDVDSYLLQNDPQFEFTADASEIATAHELGFTIPEYLQYLQGVREDPYTTGEGMRQWDADMYNLAKTYTDIADGKAPEIDPVREAARYANEMHTQKAMLEQYAPTQSYVDPNGDIMTEERPEYSDQQIDMMREMGISQ